MSWNDKCGVMGIWNDPEASRLVYLGLYALQHRGQESAGIVSLHKNRHFKHVGLGLVADVFNEECLNQLTGEAAIGHVRYSTTGQNWLNNAQPLTAELHNGCIAVAHNGNITNWNHLKNDLIRGGSIFQGSSDTEILLHLLAKQPSQDKISNLKESLIKLDGAYSFAILTNEALIAARDPYGFRPLVLGERKNSEGQRSLVVASETCAFDLIGARYLREIEPGEIFWIDSKGEHSITLPKMKEPARCIFEHVYFARPDSLVFGLGVYESRKRLGQILALESPVEADLVTPIPDSGVPAAIGYSEESGIPFELGIIRNHYVGRTFIEPQQSIRSFGVKIKLNPQSEVLRGKRVIVVDDSLVRGTTSKKIISLIRLAGATEVHMRISAPPTIGPCYYGVDTPEKSELIAAQKNIDEICEFIEADSLAYLSNAGLKAALGDQKGFCSACFDGKYPTSLDFLNRLPS